MCSLQLGYRCCALSFVNLVRSFRADTPLRSLKSSFLAARWNPRLETMSASRPSAFDILMSNASKKKKTPSQSQPLTSKESSPRKRKAPADCTSPSAASKPIGKKATQENQEIVKNSGDCRIGAAQVERELENNADDSTVSSTPAKESGSGKKLKESTLNQKTGLKSVDSSGGFGVKKKARSSISPDESVVELKKKASNFDVKRAAYWGEGEKVPFMFVVKALDAISKESGRIAITEIVCNMLRTVIETAPDDLLAVVYLLANRIAPAHEGLELGIGDASIIKALAEACGAKEAHVKKQYKIVHG